MRALPIYLVTTAWALGTLGWVVNATAAFAAGGLSWMLVGIFIPPLGALNGLRIILGG